MDKQVLLEASEGKGIPFCKVKSGLMVCCRSLKELKVQTSCDTGNTLGIQSTQQSLQWKSSKPLNKKECLYLFKHKNQNQKR